LQEQQPREYALSAGGGPPCTAAAAVDWGKQAVYFKSGNQTFHFISCLCACFS